MAAKLLAASHINLRAVAKINRCCTEPLTNAAQAMGRFDCIRRTEGAGDRKRQVFLSDTGTNVKGRPRGPQGGSSARSSPANPVGGTGLQPAIVATEIIPTAGYIAPANRAADRFPLNKPAARARPRTERAPQARPISVRIRLSSIDPKERILRSPGVPVPPAITGCS